MQEHIEDLRYITQVQADKLEKYADTAYAKELAERELRECQKYLFCHAKNILWDSTVWYLERLHLEQYRVNPSNPVKKFSFMGIEKRENREILSGRYTFGNEWHTSRILQDSGICHVDGKRNRDGAETCIRNRNKKIFSDN